MKCVYCGCVESKVIDSRSTDEEAAIRRRRECLSCGKRFTTYEVIEQTPIMVIKNNGTRQPFDAAKLKAGIVKACQKCKISIPQINELVSDVEKQIYSTLEPEIKSSHIGDLVMQGLKKLDHVAYVRFAAVYRKFEDVTDFVDFIGEEIGKK